VTPAPARLRPGVNHDSITQAPFLPATTATSGDQRRPAATSGDQRRPAVYTSADALVGPAVRRSGGAGGPATCGAGGPASCGAGDLWPAVVGPATCVAGDLCGRRPVWPASCVAGRSVPRSAASRMRSPAPWYLWRWVDSRLTIPLAPPLFAQIPNRLPSAEPGTVTCLDRLDAGRAQATDLLVSEGVIERTEPQTKGQAPRPLLDARVAVDVEQLH
jgi:hypothetical protein